MKAVHAEWIGRHCRVLASPNPALVGLGGVVRDETKHFVMLETPRGLRRVPKQGTTFGITLNGKEARVEGAMVMVAPEARLKLKVKDDGM